MYGSHVFHSTFSLATHVIPRAVRGGVAVPGSRSRKTGTNSGGPLGWTVLGLFLRVLQIMIDMFRILRLVGKTKIAQRERQSIIAFRSEKKRIGQLIEFIGIFFPARGTKPGKNDQSRS